MGYIQGADSNQVILLPDTLDEYVNEDNEVRAIVEHPYETVKRWHGESYLLTKGKVKVATETGLSFLAYNFRRVINLLGVSKTTSLIRA